MIYLFNDVKELTGTVRNNHILNLLYEREKNGIYSVSAEIPVTYNDQGTIYNYNKKIQKSDFLGHYDKEGRFQLHKIAAVDIENGSIFVKGIHIFFDEAKAGAIIKDRRFVNREIIDGARVAFESIGWSVADFDVSVGKTYNFYNVTPLEARQILVETFGFEFDYWLDFDGKKVTNRHVAVKEKIGEKTNKRYTYGHNVLNIRAEQDYSEIYTAVIGRGKGEEIEETGGYGRRIEYTDVVWTTPSKPLNKPAGTRVLEDPNATQLFGYKENGVVKPRVKVEVFSDIESPTELIQASYEWLMDNNVPKAVFSLKVADGDGLNLGDEVYVIYRDIDLIKSARVEKVIDDLVSGNRDVEFGDTAYFDTDRRLSGLRSDLKRYSGETGDIIYRLKMEFNRRFDEEVSSWVEEFEQNLIDQRAQIEADRVNMTNKIEDARIDLTDAINTEVTQAKGYAEQQAQAKADSVQSNLDSFKGSHQQLYDEVTGNIMDIDTFLGDKSKTLKQQFDKVRTDFGTLQTDLDGVESDLTATKTDLQKQLDEARAELDGLEVGGRNLLTDSNNIVIQPNNPGLAYVTKMEDEEIQYFKVTKDEGKTMVSAYVGSIYSYLSNNANIGEMYTLSVDVRIPEQGNVYFYNRRGVNEDVPANQWHRIHYTFEYTGARESGLTYYNDWIDYRLWKLEKGTVATDWTPAPEDTEQKITNINQTITNIEGELSTKVEQTEVDALKGTVTAQGTLLTQTANEVSSKAEKSVVDTLTGRVTNTESSVTQNAEEIAKKLTKSVYDADKKDTDAKITQWSNTASETAEGLTRVIGRVSQTEKGVETAQTRIEAEAGRIDGVLSRTSKVEGQVRDAQLAIEANADGLALRATKTEVEQAIDNIEVGGRNLLLEQKRTSFPTTYEASIASKEIVEDNNLPSGWYLRFNNWTPSSSYSSFYFSVASSYFTEPLTGKNITISMLVRSDVPFTFYGTEVTNEWKKVIRTFENASASNIHWYINKKATVDISSIKVEKGNKATDWTPAPEDVDAKISKVSSDLEIEAGRIEGLVTDISKDYVKQSSVKVTSDRVTIGSTSIDGDALSSVISVSPTAIDLISDKINVTGNVNIKGGVTTLAVDAIEGNFARLFASHIEATSIDVDNISGKNAWFTRAYIQNSNIEQLVSQSIFVNEINALTMNVIDLNASQIRARLLTANTIEAEWLKGGTALLDKVFASTAMFERMMAKSGFVSTLNTVTIDTDQITIRRPDGVAVINNGMATFDYTVQMTEYIRDADVVTWNGSFYQMNSNVRRHVMIGNFKHSARYLKVGLVLGMHGSSPSNSEYMYYRIESFGGPLSYTKQEKVMVFKNSNTDVTAVIDLGRPTFQRSSFYIYLVKANASDGGTNAGNIVQLRTNSAYLEG